MPNAEPQEHDPETFGVTALASTVAELCDVAADGSSESIERCDLIVDRFEASAADRRHRASSITALHLAVRRRMPTGRAKSHVDARLTDILGKLQDEGRYDAAANRRRGFSN